MTAAADNVRRFPADRVENQLAITIKHLRDRCRQALGLALLTRQPEALSSIPAGDLEPVIGTTLTKIWRVVATAETGDDLELLAKRAGCYEDDLFLELQGEGFGRLEFVVKDVLAAWRQYQGHKLAERLATAIEPGARRALAQQVLDLEMAGGTAEPYVGYLAEEIEHEVILPRDELFPGAALGERTLIVGAPGAGKTLLEVYLALCFASGSPVFGQWTPRRPLRVVLQLEEDPIRITKSRLKRLMVGMGITWSSLGCRLLVLSQTGFYASDPIARLRVERTLRDHRAEIWFLDSITQVSGIAKQGDANEVRAFFREVIDPISKNLDLTPFISHHTTKQAWSKVQMVEDEALTSGSIQFAGSVENNLLLRKTKDGDRVLRGTKSRDDEEGDGIAYKIQDDRLGPLVDGRRPLQLVYSGRMDREQVKAATHSRTLLDDLADLLRKNPGHRFTYEAAAGALHPKGEKPVASDYVRKLADQLESAGQIQRVIGGGRNNPTVIWFPETSTP